MASSPRPNPTSPPSFAGGIFMLVFGAFIVVMALFFSVWLLDGTRDKLTLALRGEVLRVNVESRYTEEGDDSTSYYLVFAYRVRLPNGEPQNYTVTISVGGSAYNRHPPGTPTEILYDPQDPSRADLKQHFTLWGWAVSSTAFVFGALLIVVFGVMGGGLLIYSAAQMRDAATLQFMGQLVTAQVVDTWTDTDSDGNTSYYLAAQFDTPTGPQTVAQSVTQSVYKQFKSGGVLSIRVATRKPSLVRYLPKVDPATRHP